MAFELVFDPKIGKIEAKETGRPPSDPQRLQDLQRPTTLDESLQKAAREKKNNPPPSALPSDQVLLSRKGAMSQMAAETNRKKSSKELRGDAEASAPKETDTVQFSNKAEQTLTQKDKFKHSQGNRRPIDPR